MRLDKASLLSSLFAATTVTVLAVGIVGAQNSGGTTSQTTTSSVVAQSSTENLDAYLQALADNLGISLDDLKAAVVKTDTARIDQAVTDGVLTQSQADELKQELTNGELFLGDHFLHGPGDHGFGIGIGGVADDVATFLGIDADALATRLRDGETLADIATAEGKTVDNLKATITAAVKANTDQAVTDGKIDQAQADEITADLATNIDDIVNGKGGWLFHGPRGPGMPGDPNTPDATATATASGA
jgi:hypothetical protein